MSVVDRVRNKHKDAFAQRTGGAKLTYTVFMAMAAIGVRFACWVSSHGFALEVHCASSRTR